MNPEIKNCQNCKNNFTIEPDDFSFYEKIKVPPPTFCPECRLQRRLTHRNERTLYKRLCDLCGENIIAMYSPKSLYIVYCPKCWYGDKWNATDYARDYDFSRTFFEQYFDLEKKIPHISLLVKNNINSPYVNFEVDVKNCYLNVGGALNQDSAYNQYALKSRDVFDNFYLIQGEFCYENILNEKSYKNFYSIFCFECRDIWFSFDCRNCSNVIGCTGLRHKNYCIFNKQLSKEEYEKFFAENLNGSRKNYKKLQKQSMNFWKQNPQRALLIEKSLNCEGNLIKESKNCRVSFNVDKSENIKYALFDLEAKDSYDITSVWMTNLCYELIASSGSISNVKFSKFILDQSSETEYSTFVVNCQNTFGCAYLRNKKYAIFNKEYSKEEYEELLQKIIKHMDQMPYIDKKGRIYKYGEFFPSELSPFSYEETIAYEYFSLNKEEILNRGLNFFDRQIEKNYNIEIIIPPDTITEVNDTVLNKAIKCTETGKLFNITKMELDFYRRFNLPLPTESPFVRHHRRLRFISDHMKLLERNCGKCNSEIESVYKKDEFPIVFCEKCYQQEVY